MKEGSMYRWTDGNKCGGSGSDEVWESSSPLREGLPLGHSSDSFLEASPDPTAVPCPQITSPLHLGKFPTADTASALPMGMGACSAQQEAVPLPPGLSTDAGTRREVGCQRETGL